jgi:hypothetical protein
MINILILKAIIFLNDQYFNPKSNIILLNDQYFNLKSNINFLKLSIYVFCVFPLEHTATNPSVITPNDLI